MARQWHTRDSMMLTEVMPSGGASLPTCANVSERVTGIEPHYQLGKSVTLLACYLLTL